jgi:hypothetical protein
VYRVALGDRESAPEILWRNTPGGRSGFGSDRVGNLVPDGGRLWSATPRRIVLFAPK